jgi:hypothetical protein
MPHRSLALAAILAVTGSAAEAGHKRHKKQHHKVAVDEEAPELVDEPERAPAKPRARDWHFAIGPNVWASSVDAKVSLGTKSVTTGIDFFQMEEHVRYGIPLLAEARYKRFSVVGDFMYGVVDVDGSRDVGPLMVSAKGTASSLQFDGIAGCLLAGDYESLLAFEARGGVRYSRTAIDGALAVNNADVTSAVSVMSDANAIAGARAFVRPYSWLSLAGNFDFGVFGSSKNTWSAAVDAVVRPTSRVLVTIGYRTLEMDSSLVSLTMHGPHAAVQLAF